MKKTVVTLFAAGTMLGAPFSTVFAEEQVSQKEVMDKMEVQQKNWNEEQGSPSFLSGELSDKKVETQKAVKEFLEENKELFRVNPQTDLTLKEVKSDDLGMKHYVYTRSVNKVPVDGAQFIVHTDKEGKVTTVNGDVHPAAAKSLKGNTQAKITKETALLNAWNHIKLTKNDTLVKVDGNTLDQVKENLESTNEKADLVVYEKDGGYFLTFKVQLQFIKPYGANWQIYVNAENGTIVDSYNAVTDVESAQKGYGRGVLGDRKELNTTFDSVKRKYYLKDTTKSMNGGYIETFTLNHSDADYAVNYRLLDADNAWINKDQGPAVDAHYHAGIVYDYYQNIHNRNSIDGRGGKIRSGVNYGVNVNNAFWNGQQMIYGDGDGSEFIPLSGSLDVVAHELTHAVTQYSAGLRYVNQSGALNESFSDVFGYFVDPANWDIGEAVYTPDISGDALRSLSNPEKYGQPSHMRDYQILPATKEGDNGGVHINSGIPNKAAYLTIDAIGIEKAEEIYYRALTTYLMPTSDFKQARTALLQSAADYDGYDSATYKAVETAWNQVGVE
ncbi:M4 family metallopeptidase [Bacillus cereus]|uniref:Neutral metalloproteinase n=2 Tax=Bacillus cereus group TaxID=86661 RepID=A0A9X0MEJ2_BACCE|nr:M4 family metallopeptidase [Bacillus cereus]HDR5276907.1 peptidase M4 family protein [Bacillus thuringiensis]KXY35643.1 peptidase M4 [Bacillus cereus]MBJ7968013.1 peptidase M4 family protein [Bacillus cereus]MBJ8004397.1 peptidase M4 family protein [Bacillus cereus]MCU5528977.1 M4 family metallopeptidase [Bacillus cereus]